MSNTSSSAGTSAVASSSTSADSLEIADEAFWVRLYPDEKNPGQLVAKNYDRKLCLFERGWKVPAHWKAGQFVLVRTAIEKEKFLIVNAPDYRHANHTDMAFGVAQVFRGQFEQTFEKPDDRAVCAWLDERLVEIMASDELEKAIAHEQKCLEAQLAREEAAAKAKAEFNAFVESVSAPLTDAGKVWFRSWLAHDRHYAFSDDAGVYRRGEAAQAKLRSEFKALLKDDREWLKSCLTGTPYEIWQQF